MTQSTRNRTESAPADKPGKVKVDARTPMDFSTLEAADEEKISLARGGDKFGALKGTKFEEWIRRTKDENHAMSVVVSTEAEAKRVASLLRLAAEKSGLGVKIPMKGKSFQRTKDGRFKILFQGSERRKYDGNRRPVQRNAESDSDFAERVTAWENTTGRSFKDETK